MESKANALGKTVAVAGMGLIGGSFYKACAAVGYAVRGFDRGDAVDVADADFVIVALPPELVAPWIREHAGAFRPGAIVFDVCGVKGPVMSALADLTSASWHFVGGHPMAGREVSGFAHATPDLFRGASMILTPPEGTPEGVLDDLRALFAAVGFARTVTTTPEHHDAMIAFTSQLCHVIANAYVRDPRVADAVGYAAGSYANMTRIATMDPAVWTALFLADRMALLDVLDGFSARLGEFRQALAAGDAKALERLIDEGATAKRRELALTIDTIRHKV